jgi:hypothetical protein
VQEQGRGTEAPRPVLAGGKVHDPIAMCFRRPVDKRWVTIGGEQFPGFWVVVRVRQVQNSVRTRDGGNAMPKERAREDNIVEITNGDRSLKFKLERNGNSERVMLVEALDQVSSPLDQLLTILNGRRGH